MTPVFRSRYAAAMSFGTVLFAALYGWLALTSLHLTGGMLVYPLDDTYIQMAMANTLASSGTYGFVAGIPAFSSTSPLWVLVLSAGALAGALEILPALLNVCAALLVLHVSIQYLISRGWTAGWLIGATAAINLVPPLAVVAAIGLEHVFHIWMSALFAIAMSRALVPGPRTRKQNAALLVTTLFLAASRFDGLILIACGALLLAVWRFRLAMAVVAVASVPVAVHGAFAIAQGWHPLPTSVIVKGNYPAAASTTGVAQMATARATRISGRLHNVTPDHDLSALAILAFVNIGGLLWGLGRRQTATIEMRMSMLAVGTLVLHALVARADRVFGRYEAYLLVLGILAAGPWLHRAATHLRGFWQNGIMARITVAATCVLAAASLVPIGARSVALAAKIPAGSHEIYLQAVQLARFTRQTLPGEPVALNDLGVLAYAGNIRPVDVMGLGTIDVARALSRRELTPARLDALVREQGAVAAIIHVPFVHFIVGGVPESWIPVADFVIPEARVVADRVVTIFALAPDQIDRLKTGLTAFAKDLPPGATVVPR